MDEFMNKQRELDDIYESTEKFNRMDFVKIIYEFKHELARVYEEYYQLAEKLKNIEKISKCSLYDSNQKSFLSNTTKTESKNNIRR